MKALTRLGLLLLALVLVTPAWGAIAHVQTVTCQQLATASCTTPSTTTTAGNLFVYSYAYYQSSTFSAFSDNKSNTITTAIPQFDNGGVNIHGIGGYVASAAGGSGHTFTVTCDGASCYSTLSVSEISGATATPLDRTATGVDSATTSHTSAATSTTTQANELLLGFGSAVEVTNFSTNTGAGWVERSNTLTDTGIVGIVTGTRVVSATGTYAYTFTTSASVNGIAAIMTFKEAAAAGTRQRCVGCGADGKVIE